MVSAPLTAPGISKDSKDRLRLWIRLLRASRTIEAELRERLKKEFDTTLPRFDVMAALYRAPEGMLMSDLSPASSTGWFRRGWSRAPGVMATAAPRWSG